MASRIAFCLLRVVLPAWVGAAVLFAINGSAEQSTTFSIEADEQRVVRDELALLRFPAYYAFGFTCVGMSIALTSVALCGSTNPRRRIAIVLAMLLVVLLLMLWDHQYIYGPLHASLDPPGQEKTSSWKRLHAASMIINLVHVSLCLGASMVLSWPRNSANAVASSSLSDVSS